MKETLIALLPGITIYAVICIASHFMLKQLWRSSRMLARFFRDSTNGRTLSRQAGYRLKIDAADEPRLYARLGRSVTIVAWTRHLSAGTSLVFPVAFITMFVGATARTEHFRLVVLITSAVHILLTAFSYVLFQRNRQIVNSASEIHEY